MNLMRFRKKSIPKDVELISDIDAILAQPIYFRLHGKVRSIKPVSTENFLKYTAALSGFYGLREQKNVTPDELINAYHELAKSISDDISRDDICQMTQAQVAAMFTLILKSVSGEAQAEAEKKKTMMSPEA